MRTLILTDIHGCAEEFKILLEHLKLQSGDRFIFLGDYIDRGPQSREVLDTILELRQNYPVTALLGNHEQMFLSFLAAPHSALGKTFLFNGGIATLANYLDDDPAILDAKMQKPSTREAAAADVQHAISLEHRQLLYELELYTQTEKFFLAHAGAPAADLNNFNPQEHLEELLWARDSFAAPAGRQYPWDKVIIHGHTPLIQAWRDEQHINLDTGVVYGNKLTCLYLEEMTTFTVANQHKKISRRQAQQYQRTVDRWAAKLTVTGRCPGQNPSEPAQEYTFTCLNYSEQGALLALPCTQPLLALDTPLDLIFHLPGGECYALKGTIMRREEGPTQNAYGIKFLPKQLLHPSRGEKL